MNASPAARRSLTTRDFPETMGSIMREEILAGLPPYPPHLHRHVLQAYTIKSRRPPKGEAEQRRAVFHYLTRTRADKSGTSCVLSSPALEAWLEQEDEFVRGWGPVPRLAALVHQFSRSLRKRYDLGLERDYKAFACYVALTLQGALRWPESLVGPTLRGVLGEPAPGLVSPSRMAFTRALHHVRRHASGVRTLDPTRPADFSQLLLRVLADVATGKLPGYVLTEEQYEHLARPLGGGGRGASLTGLVHHLTVERGLVKERDLDRADVVQAIGKQMPSVLRRLLLPARVRDGHRAWLGAGTAIEPAPAEEPVSESITVVGPFSHGSGLGAAARACVDAFQAAGIAVDVLNRPAVGASNDEHAPTAGAPRAHGDINVIHLNPDVNIESLTQFGLDHFEGRYNIGVFWWETSKACFAHTLGADLMDEVWVATPYLRDIFVQATDRPVHVVGTPVPRIGDVSWATRRYFEIPEDPFTFVYTFDGFSRFARKNPIACVDAFQQAFPDDAGVHLVIKTQNTSFLSRLDEDLYATLRTRARADRRITIIDETFSSNEVHGLISVCDCYVGLHHSEGFGLGMAEAMSMRVPVIATDYSGSQEFVTEETGWPVRCRVVPVPPGGYFYEDPGQEWADPDIAHAAQRMLEVRTDSHRSKKVERACALVKSRYDARAIGKVYARRIAEIRQGLRERRAQRQEAA